jgi:uncharacterized protein (TIGR00251 family)
MPTEIPFMKLALKQLDQGVLLPVKVIPGSSRTRIVGLLGDVLKIQLAAPPEKGKANQELIRTLTRLFNLAKSDIQLISGHSHSRKDILITSLTFDKIKLILAPYLE